MSGLSKALFHKQPKVDYAVLDLIRDRPVNHEMARQPTDDEWNKSIEDLKSFSGPGQTGLTGHMYKMLDGTNREQLIRCLNETWNRAAAGEIETAAPVAWRTGLAKILPKKPGSDNA